MKRALLLGTLAVCACNVPAANAATVIYNLTITRGSDSLLNADITYDDQTEVISSATGTVGASPILAMDDSAYTNWLKPELFDPSNPSSQSFIRLFVTYDTPDYEFVVSPNLLSPEALTTCSHGNCYNDGIIDGVSTTATLTRLSPSAVPEPACWTMFIGGFGLIGSAMRRKKTAVSFA